MSSYLIQSGTSLYLMTRAGVATAVTLPTGITLTGATNPCVATVFGAGGYPVVVVAKGGTHDFYITPDSTARSLQLSAPTAAPVVTAGAGTDLTGSYSVAVTFKVKDANGATIIESGLSPLSTAVSVTAKTLLCSNIPVSGDGTVNARGLYRTLAGGVTLYPWFDLDDNTTITDDRGVADSLLSLLPTTATTLSAPPDLQTIVTWKERLWGVPRLKLDYLRWTEERVFYGWNATNEIVAPPSYTDLTGIVALIPRRDDLGIARKDRFFKMVGNSNDTFQRVGMSETLGCVSQASVVVVRNVAYFLGERGVVEWNDSGLGYVSEAQVDDWFTSDTYFNRARFPYAQGRYNQDTDSYELLLSAAGSTSLDRWISYSLRTRAWYGPHKTTAFTPTCVGTSPAFSGTLSDTSNQPLTAFGGSDGYLYLRDVDALTDHLTPIEMSVDLPFLHAQEPDLDKVWGRFTIHNRAEEQGTLTITPIVGDLTSDASSAILHDLTLDREVLPRPGAGRYLQLNLFHDSPYERPRIYGLEIPYTWIGRR